MANAVENAFVVLIYMSPKYEKSKNCQQEASYAMDRGKRIIPIFTQKDYKPQGRCGFIAAGKRYFDFSRGSFHKNMKDLVNKIGLHNESFSSTSVVQPTKRSTNIADNRSSEGNPNELYANPDDKTTFYQRIGKQMHLMHCPSGLEWSDDLKLCDWPRGSPN